MATTTTRAKVADVMRPFEGRERIALSELLGPLGFNRDDRHYLLSLGLVEPLPERGPRRRVEVDRDQAERLATAAVIAVAVGAGMAVVLRVLAQ